jgi:hypothetical protein
MLAGPSPDLFNRLRTLPEACRELGRDDGGRKCPLCPLADLCLKQRTSRQVSLTEV